MESKQLSETLLRQAPDAVIFADHEGLISTWNPAAERIFGFSEAEAIGRSLDIIVPERVRDAHWKGYRRALAAGETKYSGQALPTRSERKNGETIYVELAFAIVHDSAEAVIGALAHARDITERWARERQQRQRLHEAERELQELREPPESALGGA